MTWMEFLSNLLQTTHKIDKAAVFNLRGQPIATSQDLQVTESDGKALLRCLEEHFPSLACVHIDGTDFRCFQGTNDAVVGTAKSNKGRVLVARRTEEALILVMGDSGSHGSFLFELQKNLLERSRGQMAPQQQQQQQSSAKENSQERQELPVLPKLPYPSVSQEQVLISLEN